MSDYYIRLPSAGSTTWQDPVATAAALPATGNNAGDVRVVLDTDSIYIWNGSAWILEVAPGATPPGGSNTQVQYNNSGAFAGSPGLTYVSGSQALTVGGNIAAANFSGSSSGSNTGDVTLTAVGSSPSANGASLSGQVLTLQPADATHPGLLTIAAQSIAGNKTFSGQTAISNTSTTALTVNTNALIVDATNKIVGIGVAPDSTVALLDIINTAGAARAVQTTGYGGNVGFRGRYANGTSGSPTAATSGNLLNFVSGRGYGATGFASASTGVLNVVAGETFTDSSMATYISLSTTPTGSVSSTERMRINTTGNVLIGTTSDNSTDKLQVSGSLSLGSPLSISYGGTGQATANTALNALLPSQTGNNGKVLSTDGSNTSWASGGTGTVTSVALTSPGVLYTVSGSPVTTSGTLALNLINQSANTILSGPSTGAAAAPSFRTLVAADLPGTVVYSTRAVNTGPGLTGGGDLSADRTISANETLSSTQTSGFSVAAGSTILTYVTNTSGGAFSVTLPAANSVASGRAFIFKDTGGAQETNPLTLIPNGADTIGGLNQNKLYYTNYGSIKIVSNGSTGWLLESVGARQVRQVFGASTTWTAQANITTVTLHGRGGAGGGGGGGGGAGGSTTAGAGGGGGGSGGGSVISTSFPVTVVPGTVYTITVGAGGTFGSLGGGAVANPAGASGSNGGGGGTGGATSFGSLASWKGALGGGAGAQGTLGGGGGAGSLSTGYYGLQGTNAGAGGAAATNGTGSNSLSTTIRLPMFTNGANAGGGTRGGATSADGGGGGASGAVLSGDASAQSATAGANGGASGSGGSNAGGASSANAGCGGSGGGGGGGGGAVGTTGSAGGNGSAGTAGSDGQIIMTWTE